MLIYKACYNWGMKNFLLVEEEKEIFGHKIIELKVKREKMKADKISGMRTAHHWKISAELNCVPFGFYVDEVFLPNYDGFCTKFVAENAEIAFGMSEGKYCLVIEKGEYVTESEWKWDPDKPRNLAKSVTVE